MAWCQWSKRREKGFLNRLEVHTYLPANRKSIVNTSRKKIVYKDQSIQTESSIVINKITDTVDTSKHLKDIVDSSESLDKKLEKITVTATTNIVDNISSTVDSPSIKSSKPKQVCVWTAEWILKRLKEEKDEDERAIALLRCWVHPKRQIEASYENRNKLLNMSESEAIATLQEFAMPKRFIRGTKGNQLDVNLTITTLDSSMNTSTQGLIDSGCTGSAIDATFVKECGFSIKKLPVPISVYNTDGTHNSGGPINEYVEVIIKIADHVERIMLAVTNLGKSKVFIGYDWLKLHNPSINWRDGTIIFDRCPESCNYTPILADIENDDDYIIDDPEAHLEEGDKIYCMDWQGYKEEGRLHYIRATGTTSTELAIAEAQKKPKLPFEQTVPEHYHEFKDIFAKEEFDALPERRPWDHAIELVPNARPVSCKVYPLSQNEQKQLDEFLEENLRSGRIRPSKSPWASPFFFVKKKDGALRPVQDYRQLNDLTVKNRYPLPLVQKLIDKLSKAKYFTKLNVR